MAAGMSNGRSKSRPSIQELLTRLKTAGAGKAWVQFLDGYAATIMHVASQYVYDRTLHNECYLFICGKLSDNGFRRLLSYQPEGAASFRSWFNVVIANLCIDWQRQQHGRVRPFKSITKLPRFDQRVFKYRFEQGLGFQTCLNSLQAEFPGLTEPQLAGAVNRINEVLTSRQHWLLSTHQSEAVSLDDSELSAPAWQPADTGDSPETTAEISQDYARLQVALAHLSPQQRLLIKLRYQQELSLKEVARLTRLGDPFRARRHIQAALADLAKQLKPRT
jgi:RNA polymerase sigma factor (sigma-70 family)